MKILIIMMIFISLQAKHKHPESYYQTIFCNNIGGLTEYYLKDKTRVDCMTKTHAYELDFQNKIYESIGQSLHYSVMTGLKPAIGIIYRDVNSSSIIRLRNVCDAYDIKLELIEE